MIEVTILHKDAKHTTQILEDYGFDMDRPMKSFQSKNVDGIVYQQLDDDEFLTLLLTNINDLEKRIIDLERKLCMQS